MRPAAGCLVLAALAGCAATEPGTPKLAPPAPVRSASVAPANEILAYLARIRLLDERGLAAEATRQREAARSRPDDLARVKLALALSLAAGGGEEVEVLALVEPVVRRPTADDDLKAMASFLQVQASERRRLRESAATAGQRLRDERRAAETQKQRADALQERAAQLQQKLDALSELEKSLSDRQAQGK